MLAFAECYSSDCAALQRELAEWRSARLFPCCWPVAAPERRSSLAALTMQMPDTRKTAESLRDKAMRCRRLARETTDWHVSRTLNRLATEEEADALEAAADTNA